MNKPADILFKTLSDLKDFLPNLVLVGGWVPYVYALYVWKGVAALPHYTTDVDMGIRPHPKKMPGTIYERLAKLRYPEKHVQMDRLFPIIPLIETQKGVVPAPLEFLCDEKVQEADQGESVDPFQCPAV